jgi:SAM-dependent methyltransferase/transcriptional regulator with XRE-family HTH domain
MAYSTPLGERLTACAKQAGGKRALAKRVGLSEAQLFRYLRGESEPTASKLIAIAEAAGLDAAWVLTGDGNKTKSTAPSLKHDRELLHRVVETFEEAAMEVRRTMPPQFKSQVVDIIYTDALMGQGHQEFPVDISHLLTLFQIYFLMGIKTEELKAYAQFMQQDFMNPSQQDMARLEPLTNHICRAGTELFNTPASQFYYDRMGHTVWPEAARRLDATLLQMMALTKKKELTWLDLGCGNGREISYIHRHYENVTVVGVDNARACIDMCQQHVDAKALPQESIVKADLRFLPFKKESFDVIYSRQTLSAFPYFPGADVGLNSVIAGAKEALRPGGVFYAITRYGNAREYAYFQQLLSEKDAERIAKEHGFEIIKARRWNYTEDCLTQKGISTSIQATKYDAWLELALKKPLLG